MQLPRTGIGVDVHALAPEGSDRPLRLAGLDWPGERGLGGHSDADVAAHAACDALLSAAALVEALGHRVLVVEGDPRAHKVTTADDLIRAERLVAAATPEGHP